MKLIAAKIQDGVRLVRRAAERPQRPNLSTTDRPKMEIVNLAPNPRFRGQGSAARIVVDGVPTDVTLYDQPFAVGGVYVHGHNVGYAADVPGLVGTTGVRVTGASTNNDTHIAPGGRNEPGQFRLGMKPGRTYTASVGVYLPRPLTGTLNTNSLRITVGVMNGPAVTDWNVAQSQPARNEFGQHRISVTFTLPEHATAAWIRLISGMSQGHGSVYWHSFILTETDAPVDYFDGDTGADAFHAVEWLGEPDASPSRRWLMDPATTAAGASSRTTIAAEAARLAGSGQLAEAGILISHLGSISKDAAYLVSRATEAMAREDDAVASNSLRLAVKIGDPSGDAEFQLGRLYEKQSQWSSAESWYRKALAKQPLDPTRSYRLAWMLEKLGRQDAAAKVSAAGLEFDTQLPFDARVLLTPEAKAVAVRREIGIFLSENLDQIRIQTSQRLDKTADNMPGTPIFIYWGQGFDAAPPLVRQCRAALYASNPAADIHELCDATVPYYVDMPADLVARAVQNRTHFSDLLRLALLEKYGGVWVDATCYVSEPLAPRLTELLEDGDLFAFAYNGPLISSWFLASRRHSYTVHMWRAAIFLWWEYRGELIDYFLLHRFFEMLYHLDADFAAQWDKGTRHSSHPPHAFQTAMLTEFDAVRFDGFLAASFVHKLRYKYQPGEVSSDSYLAHFIRGTAHARHQPRLRP